MAVPAWRAFSSATPVVATTTTIATTWPTGITSGDLVLAVIPFYQNTTASFSFSTGTWVAVQTYSSAVSTNDLLVVYWAIYGGEAAPTVTITSGNNVWGVSLIAISGTHQTTPIDVSAKTDNAASSATRTYPSVTTTVDECLILHLDHIGTQQTADHTALTNANLTNRTYRFDYTTTVGNDFSAYFWTGEKATAGATGSSTATATASVVHGLQTIAIRPPAVASNPVPKFATRSLQAVHRASNW